MKIGTLTAVKEQGLPFKVALNGNPTEKPAIEFVMGKTTDLYWNNGDQMTYPVAWELVVKNKTVSGCELVGPGGKSFSVPPKPEWFSPYESLLKAQVVDGRFNYRYESKGLHFSQPITKTMPVEVHLTYWSGDKESLVPALIILVILAFGGALSTYIKVDLGNRLRRIKLRRRLDGLARTTGEAGPQLGSRLRVALLLERKHLTDVLPSGWLFTPGRGSALDKVAVAAHSLKTRVNLAVRISDARVSQGKVMALANTAPTLMDRVDKHLSGAEALLEKSTLTTAEKEKAESLIAQATTILDNAGTPDANLEKDLEKNLDALVAKFANIPNQNPIRAQIEREAPIPLGFLNKAHAKLASQPDEDMNLRKLELIHDLVQMNRQVSSELLEYLNLQDMAALRSAELLLRQWKEGITKADVRNAIRADPPALFMQIDRNFVRANQAVMMRVVFHDPRYNQAAARRLIQCEWHFDDKQTEKGWEIYHYFPVSKPYRVRVTLNDQKTPNVPLGAGVTLDVDVQAERAEDESLWFVEVQRWLVGFVVAVILTLAAAKETIVSLDTLDAIIAIFVIGFAIDVTKNVLGSQQQEKQK